MNCNYFREMRSSLFKNLFDCVNTLQLVAYSPANNWLFRLKKIDSVGHHVCGRQLIIVVCFSLSIIVAVNL